MRHSKLGRVGVATLYLALLPLSAGAQDEIDDLERRLNSAKKSEASKQDASRRATSARAAQQARMAVLVIRADAPCRLSIDGESRALLKEHEAQTFEVLSGKQLIECDSTEETEVRVSQIQELPAGSKEVVVLQLAAEVSSRRGARDSAARERAHEQAVAEEADRDRREPGERRVSYLARWTDHGNGVLADSQTRLQWTQSDNGKKVNWKRAQRWCEDLQLEGKGWRLPAFDELKSIKSPYVDMVSVGEYFARVSPMFRLSGLTYWSGTPHGPSEVWTVYLDVNHYGWYPVSYKGARALCVRPS